MEKDKIKIWKIDKEIPSEMDVQAIYDDYEGFRVLLRSQKDGRVLRIAFTSPLAYRNTNESYLLKIWSTIDDNILGKILYWIDASSYIDYFHEMSLGVYSDWDIGHFAIHTRQYGIDILSVEAPKIQWLN